MSKLTEMYNNLSKDEQERLGKASSRIRTAGCHLVSIVEAAEIDENRIRIDFKTDAGETIDWTGWLTTKDENHNEIPNTRTLNTLTFICNAVGLNVKAVLSKTVNITKEYKAGTVGAVQFVSLTGKKLYITTSTLVEGDAKDDSKVYVKQDIDIFKFFDVKQRNGIEIASNAESGATMEAADTEAKNTFNIAYKFQGNAACERKLAELVERSHGIPGANSSTVGQIGTTAAPAEDPDDI